MNTVPEMDEFYFYRGRHGEEILTPKTDKAWDFLVGQMEQDSGITFDEAHSEGLEVEGSYEQGFLFMDDGGKIDTIGLTYPA